MSNFEIVDFSRISRQNGPTMGCHVALAWETLGTWVGQGSCPCEFMHYSGMSFGMSDTCINLGHVSCMFENMSRLSGLCWNESSFVRARTIRELRREERV